MTDSWKLGDRTFHSRIIVGTGKYASLDETRAALAASGAEIVTVALRRVDLTSKEPTLLDAIDRKKYVLRAEFETLQAAAHKLAEAMYKQAGAADQPPAGAAPGGAPKDDVIDAEFEDKT